MCVCMYVCIYMSVYTYIINTHTDIHTHIHRICNINVILAFKTRHTLHVSLNCCHIVNETFDEITQIFGSVLTTLS